MRTKNFFRMLFAASFVVFSFAACEKEGGNDNGGNGGDVSTGPDAVANSSLVAYFPFESETEAIAKGEGVTFVKKEGAASFVNGRRGNAYQGAADSYLEFDVAEKNFFKDMKGYSIAFWLKTPAAGEGAASMIYLNGGDPTMGGLNIMLEGGSDAAGLDLKSYLYNEPTTWKGQEYRLKHEAFLNDSWFHLVASYDGATSKMSYWANGMFIGDQIKYADAVPAGGTEEDQPLLGELTLKGDMTKLYIGAWAQLVSKEGIQDWMKPFAGQIDELRIYDKALTEDEVKELFKEEVLVMNE